MCVSDLWLKALLGTCLGRLADGEGTCRLVKRTGINEGQPSYGCCWLRSLMSQGRQRLGKQPVWGAASARRTKSKEQRVSSLVEKEALG